jgi:hypothetical protein
MLSVASVSLIRFFEGSFSSNLRKKEYAKTTLPIYLIFLRTKFKMLEENVFKGYGDKYDWWIGRMWILCKIWRWSFAVQ